jgi:hypothetical protein
MFTIGGVVLVLLITAIASGCANYSPGALRGPVHTTSADASAEGKASVARIGPHSRRQYSSTNTIGESPTVVTTAGATFAEPTSPAPRGT